MFLNIQNLKTREEKTTTCNKSMKKKYRKNKL